MNENGSFSLKDDKVEEKPKSAITSEKIVEDIKNAQNKWDGVPIYKMLKFLFKFMLTIIIIVELFAYIWPRVESKFPEIKSTEEKCKTAVCPKICNGKCECTYKNKFDIDEKVTCVIK